MYKAFNQQWKKYYYIFFKNLNTNGLWNINESKMAIEVIWMNLTYFSFQGWYNQCVKNSGIFLGIFLHVQLENHQTINEISFNSEDILIQFN